MLESNALTKEEALAVYAGKKPEELSVEKTIEKLNGYVYIFSKSTLLLANWTALIPEVEVKIILGDHIHRDATAAQQFANRLASLAKPTNCRTVESRYLTELINKVSRAGSTELRLFGMYKVLKSRLLGDMIAHKACTHRILDEPTARLLSDRIGDLRKQILEATSTIKRLCCLFPEMILNDFNETSWNEFERELPEVVDFHIEVPEVPARDSRFKLIDRVPLPPKNLSLEEGVIMLMHFNLMSLEIPTIEACGRLIIEFTDMPWEFVLDMGRQCWDEARHARACYERVLELGGEIGQYPVEQRLWLMTSGLPLEMRLAIHQRIGESIGVDAAVWSASDLERRGDPITARIYEYIVRDEITHVAFGNKWLRFITKTDKKTREVHRKAELRRQEFGDSINGNLPFPFNRWACELSGFTKEEVDELEEVVRRRGSYRSIPPIQKPQMASRPL